jgi:hypothetical protein
MIEAAALQIASSPKKPSLGSAPQKVAPLVRGVEATRPFVIFPNRSFQPWRIADSFLAREGGTVSF